VTRDAVSVAAIPSPRAGIARISWWLLLATLALLPFEFWLPEFPLGRLTVTSVEAVWGLAVLAWLATLLIERRRPRLPRRIALGVAVLLVAGLASAATADGRNLDAVIFVGRTAAAWLLFAAVADMAVARISVREALVSLVCGATVSAVIGLVLFASPALADLLDVQVFTAAGAPRLGGTFQYPNTAAMAYEATALLALGLAALDWPRAGARLAVAAAGVLLLAMILTLSRGATAGAAAGLVAMAALAIIARRRRLGVSLGGAAVSLVVLTLLIEVAVAPIARLFSDAETGLYGAIYTAPAEIVLEDGRISTTVTVQNTGSLEWNPAGADAFRLGFHLLGTGTPTLTDDGGETFPLGDVRPGDSTAVIVTTVLPQGEPGEDVAWDVRRGSYGWLSAHGVPAAVSRLVSGSVSNGGPTTRFVELSGDEPLAPPRSDLWRAAASMVLERPVLGVGPGTFRLRYGPYLGLAAWDERASANNLFLELAATTGVVGLALFLIVVVLAAAPLLALLAKRVARVERALPANREWLAGAFILAALAAFIGHGFVDYFFAINSINGLWAATLALALAAPVVLMGREA
jgi:O-antigen ligase